MRQEMLRLAGSVWNSETSKKRTKSTVDEGKTGCVAGSDWG